MALAEESLPAQKYRRSSINDRILRRQRATTH